MHDACLHMGPGSSERAQVMGIMALLAEIYALDRLKLNLKFEIEMVFRNLGLQVHWPCQVQRHTCIAADDSQAACSG